MWTAALASLRQRKRLLAEAAGICALALPVINAPWTPGTPWMRGFSTAAVVVGVLGIVTWCAWVPTGLAFRLQGAQAEDWTAELLSRHPDVLRVVPSLKFGTEDIDHVAITATRILAVETKWSSREPTMHMQRQACEQAGR